MKQTAIQLLKEKWYKGILLLQKDFDEFEEMEKEQIIDAYVECWKTHVPKGIECKLPAKE